MFLQLSKKGNVYCCCIATDSPQVNAEKCKLYNAVKK